MVSSMLQKQKYKKVRHKVKSQKGKICEVRTRLGLTWHGPTTYRYQHYLTVLPRNGYTDYIYLVSEKSIGVFCWI